MKKFVEVIVLSALYSVVVRQENEYLTEKLKYPRLLISYVILIKNKVGRGSNMPNIL